MARPRGCPGMTAALSSAESSLPASFICETISERPHMVSDSGPFRATYDTDVLNGQYGEEQILIGFWKHTISAGRLTGLMAAAAAAAAAAGFMFT